MRKNLLSAGQNLIFWDLCQVKCLYHVKGRLVMETPLRSIWSVIAVGITFSGEHCLLFLYIKRRVFIRSCPQEKGSYRGSHAHCSCCPISMAVVMHRLGGPKRSCLRFVNRPESLPAASVSPDILRSTFPASLCNPAHPSLSHGIPLPPESHVTALTDIPPPSPPVPWPCRLRWPWHDLRVT